MSSLSRASGRVRSLIRPTSACANLRSSLLLYSSSSQDVKTDGKKNYLVDTLAFVKRLEAQGLPTNQAEAITESITEATNNSLEHATRLFASMFGMDKFEVIQGSTLTQFMSEMKNMQENNFEKIKHEIEKMGSKFDKEILAVKFEIIKYCIGSFISVATISFVIVRFWMI